MSSSCVLFRIGVLLLNSHIIINGKEQQDLIFYGACYQLNSSSIASPRIVLSTLNQPVFFTDYGFETSSNASSINCVWFISNQDAQSARHMNIDKARHTFNTSTNIQYLHSDDPSPIHCHNQIIAIHTSAVNSKHLCSDSCNASCIDLIASPREIPLSYQGESDVSPFVPSMFGISGICIAFIIVCVAIYCFGIRYSRWTVEKSGNETEKVIGDVLDEIAKYTIGDDEEGFYDDWNAYGDSDQSDSSHSIEEALGRTILRVVSNHRATAVYSSDSDSESNEEQLRQDLLVAKETLYAVSYGTDNPYSTLTPIEEQVVEKKVSLNNRCTPKKSPLLSSEWSDHDHKGVSSDASTGALP
eukprot:7542_1